MHECAGDYICVTAQIFDIFDVLFPLASVHP